MTTHTEITPDILIALRNIVKNYYIGTHKVRVLKSINLTIKKQEFLAIMGPSGSGKTTLMNILGCLDTPSEGEYSLAQKDV
ncbi:MAG: ATP-binding cassette domain-containing protein, partial [Planctomycetota bacterium]